MYNYYFKVALRVIGKYKFFSFLNITSLSLGLFPCILLLLLLQYEYSFDTFHDQSENIYRIVLDGHYKSGPFKTISTSPRLAEAIKAEFPDTGELLRLSRDDWGSPLIRYEDKLISESNYLYADSNLFSFFNIQLEKGNPKTALEKPHSVVITNDFAKKYFGEEDPIGQVINVDIFVPNGSDYPMSDRANAPHGFHNPSGMDPAGDYMVTGVVKNLPPNTHIQFDFVMSMSSIYFWDTWGWDLFSYNAIATYIKLTPNNSQKSFEYKLNSIVDKYHAVAIEKVLGIEYSQVLAEGKTYKYSLMPLTKMHFEAEGLRTKFEKLGVYKNIYFLSIISLISLLIGCINFINLSTARSSNRAKEIGIRKVSGSGKFQLIKQFLLESLMLSFISMLLAIIIAAFLLPYFNSFLDTSITLYNIVFTWVFPAILTITALVGIIAGIYPAYILSALKPALIIKGNYGSSPGGKGIIRNVLVLFQYGISIIFIMGTLIIQGQLNFMYNKDLGYDKEQVLKLSGMRGESPGRYLTFKQGLLKINGVKSVSRGDNIFLRNRRGWRMNLRTIGSARGEGSEIIHTAAGVNLIENLQLKIISDKTLEVPDEGYFLTESAVKALKLTNPVGEYLICSWVDDLTSSGEILPDQDTLIVCGVIQDFHYRSALNKIEPVTLVVSNGLNDGRALMGLKQMGNVFVKLTGNDIQQTVADIETIWKDLGPDKPFTYTFLDLEIDKFYAEEQKMSKLIGLFSLLAILISCLGILGLSAYLAQRKNKEISIRKIFGASLIQIVGILVKKHAKLILMAILIFMPIAYLFGQKWLSNYPYRITIDVLTIVTTIVAIILITGISISWQLVKGGLVNPLETIKSE